jgi:ribosomal protein L34E
VWKARCPRLVDRTISGWPRTKTSLSSPKPTFKIRNTHTCFCRPRLLEQAALGADLTPININSPVAGIIPRHQRNPCGAPLRAWKIPRMAGRLMRSRLIPAARTASLARYTRRQLSLPWYRRTCEWRDSRSCRLPGNRLINNLIPLATARPARLHRCGSTTANGDGLPSGRPLDFRRWLLSFQQVPRIGAHR